MAMSDSHPDWLGGVVDTNGVKDSHPPRPPQVVPVAIATDTNRIQRTIERPPNWHEPITQPPAFSQKDYDLLIYIMTRALTRKGKYSGEGARSVSVNQIRSMYIERPDICTRLVELSAQRARLDMTEELRDLLVDAKSNVMDALKPRALAECQKITSSTDQPAQQEEKLIGLMLWFVTEVARDTTDIIREKFMEAEKEGVLLEWVKLLVQQWTEYPLYYIRKLLVEPAARKNTVAKVSMAPENSK